MICLRPLIVLVVAGLACIVSGKDGDELIAVVVLFRHGDRSPMSSWPNDIYFGNSSLWPDGYGQLNNMGKERHYRLGQWFRERYDGFLPRRYNRSDIYVRSTDVDRTLMSAASNLAGLYPPEGDQNWNENIHWQAIPIHTTPEDQDPILTASIECPKHDKLLTELLNSEEFQQMNEDFADFFQNISDLTGYSSIDFDSFGGIFSTVTIYRGFNLSLPLWTEMYWPEIKAFAAKDAQLATYTPELARLRVGPFFDYLLSYFKAVKENNFTYSEHINGPRPQVRVEYTTPPKLLMLSAHDTTVADRTNAMGVFADAVPEFASTVIWEIKSNEDDTYYVNMYYKNSSGISELTLPGCQFDCSLEEFGKLVDPISVDVDQWHTECYE